MDTINSDPRYLAHLLLGRNSLLCLLCLLYAFAIDHSDASQLERWSRCSSVLPRPTFREQHEKIQRKQYWYHAVLYTYAFDKVIFFCLALYSPSATRAALPLTHCALGRSRSRKYSNCTRSSAIIKKTRSNASFSPADLLAIVMRRTAASNRIARLAWQEKRTRSKEKETSGVGMRSGIHAAAAVT